MYLLWEGFRYCACSWRLSSTRKYIVWPPSLYVYVSVSVYVYVYVYVYVTLCDTM
jgi:hypothetical protein